jgi:hypothetical protein
VRVRWHGGGGGARIMAQRGAALAGVAAELKEAGGEATRPDLAS